MFPVAYSTSSVIFPNDMARKRNNRRTGWGYFLAIVFVGLALTALSGYGLIVLLVVLVPSIPILAVSFVVYQRYQRAKRQHEQAIDDLSPAEFEHRIRTLLRDLGWRNVHVRGGRGDRGVDITAQRDGLQWVVQCKHYRARNVAPKEVRELVGTMAIQKADRALFVTSGLFTEQGRKEAHGQGVELWDRETLIQRIREAEGQPRGFLERVQRWLMP